LFAGYKIGEKPDYRAWAQSIFERKYAQHEEETSNDDTLYKMNQLEFK
jgi:hypothetical protein